MIFCSKTLQNKINQIQKRALLIVYNEPNLNLDKLVEPDKSTAIHIKNNNSANWSIWNYNKGKSHFYE